MTVPVPTALAMAVLRELRRWGFRLDSESALQEQPKGSIHGVERNNRYVIFARGPRISSMNNEFLEKFDEVEGTGHAIHGDEKFSVLRSLEKRMVPPRSTEVEKRLRATRKSVVVGLLFDESKQDLVPAEAPFKSPVKGDFAERV